MCDKAVDPAYTFAAKTIARLTHEEARTDITIPTLYSALPDCLDCEMHGRCVCWTWADEAEFRTALLETGGFIVPKDGGKNI